MRKFYITTTFNSVIEADTKEDAIEAANRVIYAMLGGCYSSVDNDLNDILSMNYDAYCSEFESEVKAVEEIERQTL